MPSGILDITFSLSKVLWLLPTWQDQQKLKKCVLYSIIEVTNKNKK